MGSILYYISLPIIYFISLMPFWFNQGLADLIFSLRKITGRYRDQVVLANLRKSFPDKPEVEIQKVADEFYHYIIDLVFETLKLLTISQKGILKHMKFEKTELLKKLSLENRSIIFVMGHLGNWEMCSLRVSLKYQMNCPSYGIYHPLTNKHFDGLVKFMRQRMGMHLITMENTASVMIRNKEKESVIGFLADQTPSYLDAHWMMFMNQETLVYRGVGLMARRLNHPVVYLSVKRLRRGYYSMHPELLVDNPSKFSEDQITQMHTRRLEEDITNQPEIWLWSHRRWKKEKPSDIVIKNLLEDTATYSSTHV